jgi:hypothetical protein
MCAQVISRQPEPSVVSPPPPTVPRLMVTDSRMVFSSPISTRVGSPLYFRSCGGMPIEVNG